MKKSRAKSYVIIGGILIILSSIIIPISSAFALSNFITILVILTGSFGNIGIILALIGIGGWNSENREKRRDELHKAQLRALNRGKVNAETNGKMKKLR